MTDATGTVQYGYDPVGNRAFVDYPNGTSASYVYDDLNRLTELTNTDSADAILTRHTYTLGLAGNRLQMAEATGRVVDYVYDDLYRLLEERVTDAANGDRSTVWAYDMVGNRQTQSRYGTTVPVPGAEVEVTSYVYDGNDRLVTETTGGVTTAYAYDANGNTVEKAAAGTVAATYAYDFEDRLVETGSGGSTTTYTYEPAGIRQSKTVDGTTVRYLVDPNRDYSQVIEEQDLVGSVDVLYTYGDDLVNQQRAVAGDSWYHYDGLGSVRALSDATGAGTDEYTYEAFGEVEVQVGATPNIYLFTGEQFDPNVGFYYLRARYYGPGNGRFLNLDLWAGRASNPITLNKYLYTHSNPVNGTDPSGLVNTAEQLATVQITSIPNVGAVTRVGQISFAANDAIYAGTAASTAKLVGLTILAGLGAAGAQLFDLLVEDDDEPKRTVPYYRAVDTGEMVDILDCNCFRFPDLGYGIEPTAVKRFWLDQSSAVTFGNDLLKGDFVSTREDSFFVVRAVVSERFDALVASIQGGTNPGDAFIGAGRAVGLPLLPALNKEAQRHGGIVMVGEY